MVDAIGSDLLARAVVLTLCSFGICYTLADLSGPKMIIAHVRARLNWPGCAYCLAFWICPMLAVPLCFSVVDHLLLSAAGIGGVHAILMLSNYGDP